MLVLKRNLAIAFTGVIFLVVLYEQHNFLAFMKMSWSNKPSKRSNSEKFTRKHDNRVTSHSTKHRVKTIQWFDSYHSGHGLRIKSKNVRMDKCEYKNCQLLEHYIVPENDGNIYGPLDADAVIFQGCHLPHFLPPVRRDENQVFVFAERETWLYMGAFERMLDPALNKTERMKDKTTTFQIQIPDIMKNPIKFINMFRFRSLFNWTMTYRRDSDIFMPYGEVLTRQKAANKGSLLGRKSLTVGNKDYSRIYYSKIRDAVWLVSDCVTKSKREQYVKQLSQYINVDVYGACGTLSCPKQIYDVNGKNCLTKIIKEYKFILSFENTFHTDYVTEKLFDWMSRDIVQVVYGMADYASITPAGSIINAEDFKSPKELANFMKKVGADKNRYVKYLKIKDRHIVLGHNEMQQNAYCKLCEKLNNLHSNRRSYPNIGSWWQLNDTSGFQNLYSQALGVHDNVQNRLSRYLYYFIPLVCMSSFFIFFFCLKKQRK